MEGYDEFISKIKKMTNINLSFYKEKQMKRRIDALIRRNNLNDYDSYISLLKKSEEHLNEFLNYITINVSEFFRNPIQWQVLEKKLIPQLFSKSMNIKTWSSACASGEEPYSMAILLSKLGLLKKAEIIATDIDISALEKAKKGLYSKKSLANLSEADIKKYFDKTQELYAIKNEIKDNVKFKRLNLLSDNFPPQCDLILCRNVMIYFTDEAKNKLYHKFSNALKNEGILFVGSTEQIIMPQKYGLKSIQHFFYQKSN